jgi:alcohol dehydrogenase class IV
MGKRALIVHSKSTYEYAKKVAKDYDDVKFLLVKQPPTSAIGYWMKDSPTVIGIGGGSVIDTAKLIANPKRCIAIPTTASGAAMTPYATIWGKKKKSIECPVPIMQEYKDDIKLSDQIIVKTYADSLCHIAESLWSVNITQKSERFSLEARNYLHLLQKDFNIKDLIKIGNHAGKAIAITKTNIIHAMSYPLTIEYGIEHGLACALLFNHVVKFLKYEDLFKNYFITIKKFNIKIDPKKCAKLALQYPKIHDIPKKVTEKDLIKIYKKL